MKTSLRLAFMALAISGVTIAAAGTPISFRQHDLLVDIKLPPEFYADSGKNDVAIRPVLPVASD